MKIRRISRRTPSMSVTNAQQRPRSEVMRTAIAVTLALALIGTGAIALPSFAPIQPVEEDTPTFTVAPLEPELLADIETVHESAGMLASPLEDVAKAAKAIPAAVVKAAKVTRAVTK